MSHLPDPVADLSLEPFEYVGGNLALDLINTADWTAAGAAQDRLASYDRLTRWAEQASVLPRAAGERLRRAAAAQPDAGEAALAEARRVRQALRQLFGAIAGGAPSVPALRRFNALLTHAMRRLEVVPAREARPGAPRYRWAWASLERNLTALLDPVLWSAAGLLTSEELGQVRVCAGTDCGWMYVDRSRNGHRRWCQMRTCGTREKTRRRRAGLTA